MPRKPKAELEAELAEWREIARGLATSEAHWKKRALLAEKLVACYEHVMAEHGLME